MSPAASVAEPYRVVVANDPDAWSDGSTRSGLLGLSPSARVAAFERLTDGDTRLVILCDHRQVSRVNREAAVARGILETPVAVVPLSSGPLGQYAMARIAERSLAVAGRPSTLVISLLRELATRLVDIGLVGSVKALDIPGIKLRHHLASYLPGSHLFAVQLTPTPFVAAAGRPQLRPAAAEAIARTDLGAVGVHVLIAGPRPIPPALEEHLGSAGAAVTVTAELDLASYWRDPRASEVVVVPTDPAIWVAQEVPVQAGRPCNWCGELLATTAISCVFCGHTPL